MARFLGVRHLGMQVVDGEQSVTSARVKASIDEGSRSLIHQCRQPSMELKKRKSLMVIVELAIRHAKQPQVASSVVGVACSLAGGWLP